MVVFVTPGLVSTPKFEENKRKLVLLVKVLYELQIKIYIQIKKQTNKH